jgi:hypothetical protein
MQALQLRPVVLEAFDGYLNCGILIHCCARAYCQNCKHSELIAFSCKRRGLCPSCDAKRALIFAEKLHINVIGPHPVRHLVFSIPKRLRVFFKVEWSTEVREIQAEVQRKGRKSVTLRLWTDLLDERKAPAPELAELYASR